MFRRRPASSFRGRQRTESSSSSSSSEEEETKGKGEPYLVSDQGESAAGAQALDAGSQLSGNDAVEALAEGPRKANSRPVPSRALLSFGADEEREEEVDFKIKKASVKTITFRAQKKENWNPISKKPERSQEMKGIDPEQMSKEDEPLSPDYKDSSDSVSECSSEDSADNIPDAAFIKRARRKRHLARAQSNYLSLNVSNDAVQRKETEDEETEDESDNKGLEFAPKFRALGDRMIKDEDIEEDEMQNEWEEQQIKKALKLSQGIYAAVPLSTTKQTQTKIDAFASLPPINMEIVKKRLNRRIALLQDIHRSHQREYEKYTKDIEDSKTAAQELEKSSNAASNYKFYRAMKTYIGNLIDCLNEKVFHINELELEMYILLKQQAQILLKRRQEDLRNESSYIQLLTKNSKSSNGCMEDDIQKLLEDCKARRRHRREKRECSSKVDHHEGMSSDDERPPEAAVDFQKKKNDILQNCKNLFEDVHMDYCTIRNILLKFQHWKDDFPDSYYNAYISLCLPKLLNPLIRVQLIDWNLLEEDCVNLKDMPWFRDVKDFLAGKNVSQFERTDDPDENILAKIIDNIIFPKITGFVDYVWDPLSTSQTKSLVQSCKNVFEEYSFLKTDSSKAKQYIDGLHSLSDKKDADVDVDLLNHIISRMKKSIEDDVFIPLYPKSAVEDKTSSHATFQDRQFWSTVKLLSNILLWDSIIPEDVLQELGLSKLVNRYLLLIIINLPSGPDNVEKCTKVVACLPERWFRECEDGSSLPQLSNFNQHLLQLARALYKDNCRNEIKDVILLLAKVKALHIADDFLEEYQMEHLKSILNV